MLSFEYNYSLFPSLHIIFLRFSTPHRALAEFAPDMVQLYRRPFNIVDSGRGVSNSSLHQGDTEVVASVQSD
jgi:hypothetical protein